MKNARFIFCVLWQLFLSSLLCKAQTITTIAGTGVSGYSGDGGPATAARLNGLHGIVMDAFGNTYIADKGTNRIRKISPLGIISTIAGNGVAGHSGDGGPATAALINDPFQIALDASGNLYFCELSNYVRKISPSGIISSIAGTGISGSTGDGGPATAARLSSPQGLAIDASGNIYVADFYNNRVRVINPSGIISAFAGTGSIGYSGDGGAATAALLDKPNFLFIDHLGNLFISDNDNHVIRKVNTSGIITTFAGNGSGGFAGDGGPATAASLNFACGVFEDAVNNIYIADNMNNRVRMVDPSGIINTVVGNGSSGYSGDGGPASVATLDQPVYVYINNSDLYISDLANSVIRKVIYSPTYISDSFSIYINGFCSGIGIRALANHYSAGMYVKTYFGDGVVDSSMMLSSGSSPYVSHTYMNSGAYTIKQVLYIASTAIDTFEFTYNHTICNSFTIKFYYDANSNCIMDGTDFYNRQPTTVEVDSAGIAIDTLSCTSGLNYKAYGSVGTVYAFKIISMTPGLLATCPSTGVIYDTISSTSYSPAQKYLGLSCSTSPGYDLRVFASFRAGSHHFGGTIIADNTYCIPQVATLTMQLSPTYNTSLIFDPAPTTISGNFVTWNLSALSFITSSAIIRADMEMAAGATPAFGDTVMTRYSIAPISGDSNPVDNAIIRVDTVKSGYDPNDIGVIPSGCIMANDSILQYTIHFENTGNDTAFNIYILDTLPSFVNPHSIRILAASATMFTSVIRSGGYNILKFDFPGINLLDSSHHSLCDGMVTYKIDINHNLVSGTTILNRAGIYFDYNPVVLTNSVENVIGCPVAAVNNISKADAVTLQPNPAFDAVVVKADHERYTLLSINNAMGQQLIQQSFNAAQTKIDVSILPPGLYYVTLRGEQGSVVKKFVKL